MPSSFLSRVLGDPWDQRWVGLPWAPLDYPLAWGAGSPPPPWISVSFPDWRPMARVMMDFVGRQRQRHRDQALQGERPSRGAARSVLVEGAVQVDQAAVAQVHSGVAPWAGLAARVSQEVGVPAEMLLALIDIESDGNPKARNASSGAMGLVQVMPYHFQPGEDPYDPETNLRVGARILRRNFDRIKQRDPSLSDQEAWEKAAAAYFGAFDWNTLQVTGARDAVGTSGHRYVQAFRDLSKVYAKAVSTPQPDPRSQPTLSGPIGEGLLPASAVTGGRKYPVTQEFGQTEFARTSGMYRGGVHPGYDIGVPEGTTITAPLDGVVVQAGWNGGYGNSVTIRLQDGRYILVGHLSRVTVSVNQRVRPGDILGYSGNTGASTGPHLHLEVRDPNGNPVDPRVLFTF